MESYPRQRARTRAFRLGVPRLLTPSPDGQRVAFLRSRGGGDPVTCLWVWDVATASERCVADPAELLAGDESLPPEEQARRERLREVTAGITDMATDRDVTIAAFALSGVPYVVRLDQDDATLTRLDAPGPVIDPRVDPTGARVAFVCDRGLYVVELHGSDGAARPVCLPDGEDDSWGLADFIAAEELQRVRGYWWLSDGSGLLVEHVDDSPVATWWIADPAHPDQAPRAHRYPAAGTDNADVELWSVALDGSRRPVEWDHQALPYLATVAVGTGSDPVISVLSRDQRRQVVYAVDPMSGLTSLLAERTDPQWVEVVPGVPRRDAAGRLLEVVADRDADTYRLVVDDVPITPPGLQVSAVLDAADDVLVSASDDPMREQVVAVAHDGTVTPMALGGISTARRAGALVVTSDTDLDRTRSRARVWTAGQVLGEIDNLAEVPVLTPQPRIHLVGDQRLRTAVLLPTGHVPGSARLPVIMAPYGGPHARLVMASGLSYGSAQWLADQGYAVIVADGRGTGGRGPGWDRLVSGDVATPALEDQVAALHGIAEEYPDDLDLSRVGIRGWSFGGYLAALAVLARPDVFHAAVAGAPVTDWRLYDTAYTERYLGDPRQHPEQYDAASLIALAPQLSRPLLIIHGLADDNVVVAHTLQLSSALLAAGKPHSVLPLSGVTHMTPQEVVAENLLRAEVEFFGAALA